MLGHKNMNLNIKQCLPAPKNTLTLQAICLNIKKIITLKWYTKKWAIFQPWCLEDQGRNKQFFELYSVWPMHDEVGDFPRQATYAHEHVKCK